MVSFLSWAVSTKIRNGPYFQRTATKSQIEMTAKTVQTVHSGRYLIKTRAIRAETVIR